MVTVLPSVWVVRTCLKGEGLPGHGGTEVRLAETMYRGRPSYTEKASPAYPERLSGGGKGCGGRDMFLVGETGQALLVLHGLQRFDQVAGLGFRELVDLAVEPLGDRLVQAILIHTGIASQ